MTEEPLNQLYQFLRTSFRAIGEAHRTNPRRHASTPARLTWTEATKQPMAKARLIDISRAGAALLTTTPPPEHTPVRIRLVGPERTPWIEAEVLGVDPQAPGRHKVRLRFREPCPTYFLRVAVLGPIITDEAAEGAPASPATPAPTTDPHPHPEPVDLSLDSPSA